MPKRTKGLYPKPLKDFLVGFQSESRKVLFKYCQNERMSCKQVVCLIPSKHAFLIVSVYFEFYKSVECRIESLKS